MSDLLWKERIAYVRKHVTVVELFERYGWELPRSHGDQPFQVACPFKENHAHGDRSKSMRIYPPDGFYCFTCGVGGDVFDLVGKAMEEKTGKRPSLKKLVEYFEGICGRPDLDMLILDKAEGERTSRIKPEVELFYVKSVVSLRNKMYDAGCQGSFETVWQGVPVDLEGVGLSELDLAFKSVEKRISEVSENVKDE